MVNVNPYSSPRAEASATSVPRTRNRSPFVISLGVGAVAALLVHVGDALQWPHFNRREGYLGTEFLRDLLYAINDPYAIHIVALLWFAYAALLTGALAYASKNLWRKRFANKGS